MTDRETPAGAVEALARLRALFEAEIGPYEDLSKRDDLSDRAKGQLVMSDAVLSHVVAEIDKELAAASLTRSVDVERWQRIETAARAFADATVDYRSVLNAEFPLDEYRALRDALGEG